MVSKVKGGESSHAKILGTKVIKFILDGVSEGKIKEEDMIVCLPKKPTQVCLHPTPNPYTTKHLYAWDSSAPACFNYFVIILFYFSTLPPLLFIVSACQNFSCVCQKPA